MINVTGEQLLDFISNEINELQSKYQTKPTYIILGMSYVGILGEEFEKQKYQNLPSGRYPDYYKNVQLQLTVMFGVNVLFHPNPHSVVDFLFNEVDNQHIHISLLREQRDETQIRD